MLILKGVAFHLRVRGTSVPCDLFATLPLALLWNSPPPPNPLACVCFGEDGGWGWGWLCGNPIALTQDVPAGLLPSLGAS